MTRLGFRSRLFLVSVFLILCFGVVSGVILENRLSGLLSDRTLERLSQEARLGAELVEMAPSADDYASMDDLADRISRSTKARVTIIDGTGRVMGDSRVETGLLPRIENHLYRPEVQQVLTEGHPSGHHTRVSATVGEELTYVAVAYTRPGAPVGVVRLAVPTTEARAEVVRLRMLMGLAGLVGMLVAAFMSILSAQLVTRELRGLVGHARALIQDEQLAEDAVPTGRIDVFQGLSGSLNRLGEALENTMASLAKERDRFGGVLNSMQDGVLALSRRGRIKVWNAAALDHLELPEENLRNRWLRDLVDSPELVELVQHAREGREGTAEFTFRPPGDSVDTVATSTRRLLTIVSPLREQPGRTGRGCVIVIRDVTALRRLETVRRDFVTNASHELRTPVSVIQASAEALEQGAVDEPEAAQVFLRSILRNAQRQAALIDDLLSLARLEAGRTVLDLELVDLRRAAARVMDAVAVKAAESGHTVHNSVPAGLHAVADDQSLDQVLTNLLANAVAYVPPGGTIEVAAERRPDGYVRMEVRDDGPGVARQHRRRLFERFYRVDTSRSRATGGTGLGLAIVKHLAEAMNGRAGFRPNLPVGAVFWLDLPLAHTQRWTNEEEDTSDDGSVIA